MAKMRLGEFRVAQACSLKQNGPAMQGRWTSKTGRRLRIVDHRAIDDLQAAIRLDDIDLTVAASPTVELVERHRTHRRPGQRGLFGVVVETSTDRLERRRGRGDVKRGEGG